MSNRLNIQNTKETGNENYSLWTKGRKNIKKFYEVKLKRSTNIKTFLYGILLTIIVMIPFALLLVTLYKAYIYNLNLRLLFVITGWVLIWICNGLSNYFTIKLAQCYFKEDPKLNSVDAFSVFIYETFNPGFIAFTFFIMLFLFFGLMGA